MKVTNIVIITDEGTAGVISPEKLQIVQVEGGSLLGIPNDDGTSLFPIVQFAVNLSPLPEPTEAAPAE